MVAQEKKTYELKVRLVDKFIINCLIYYLITLIWP